MLNYNSRYVNILSLIISIVIFISLNNIISFLKVNKINSNFIFSIFKKNLVLVEMNSKSINQNTKEEISKDVEKQSKIFNVQNEKNNSPLNNPEDKKEWKISIPQILLEAEISEGTSKDVMDKFVGHFEETSKENGNIGLAAHNRGYSVNYFSDLKKLKEGDEIFYKYNNFEKIYVVDKHIIIKDEDWNYLEKTEDNRITLITCVENEPEYRRCIQGIEKNWEFLIGGVLKIQS